MRVWNIQNGDCIHTLTGHTSLVGLLGLSPSYLVSAAADSTLRIWDPDSGELRHTLAAHTGAITCFQHDEFKVLSGSDGNLKMWNVRDGSVVRDLLTGITGVWQVVFEGRWCVAASNRNDATVLDVWDFGEDEDEDWFGEPPNGLYDEDIFSESGDEDANDPAGDKMKAREVDIDDDDEQEQADIDAMDQDLVDVASETDSVVEADRDFRGQISIRSPYGDDVDIADLAPSAPGAFNFGLSEGVDASRWAPNAPEQTSSRTSRFGSTDAPVPPARRTALQSSAAGPSLLVNAPGATPSARPLPNNDETPTRPRVRAHNASRRR